MPGISATVLTLAERDEAAPLAPGTLGPAMANKTCIFSTLHVTTAVEVKFGQAPPGASDTICTAPDVARHSVTAPFEPTASSRPFTTPVPSPMVPPTDAGATLAGCCANPVTSIRLARCAGSSKPTTDHVD